MQTLYNSLKLLHIVAVIVWVGGLVAAGVITALVARQQDRSAMAALAQANGLFGRAVIGPAAGLTLIAGVAMVLTTGMSFATLWISWGLIGVAVSLLLGAVFIRRAGDELSSLARADRPDPDRASALQQRLRVLNILNLLLLLSVVWAMVFKPTL